MTAAEGTAGETGSPPDNPEALVEEINRTREELGNTVDALAAKADMKARAQQRATEVSGQLKSRVRDVTQGLSGKADQLKGEVSGRAAGARQAVTENGKTALGAGEPVTKSIASRASQAGTTAQGVATKAGTTAQGVATKAGATVWAATPEPVQQRARRAAATVNQHRVPFAAAATAGALLLTGWLVVRSRRR
ncbi:MAG TPA: DUF3618 domain-containing protein [Streptosporangiaceae bacterium]